MDVEQFRRAGYQAIDRICDYWYNLEKLPVVSGVKTNYLRELVPSAAPKDGEDFQEIADDFQKLIVPGLTHWQHPSFFAYFPQACTFEGILAELYQTSVTNPGFNWTSSPACTELEIIVMDWMVQLLSLSPDFLNSSGVGGGVLQTSASDSCLVAIVAARCRAVKQNPSIKTENLIIYTTTQTHSLGVKAGLVLGIQVRALEVTLEDNLGLNGDTLRRALAEDAANGLKPFILIASLGTTSSGAIDKFPEIREVVKDHPDLWVHVDAAWAGVALSCPENHETCYLEDMNAFVDSFSTNFHKWGLVPFGASCLWVRNRTNLTDALDVTPPFLKNVTVDSANVIDYRNWHLGLGRSIRSFKFWFVLRGYGVSGFQAHIRRGVSLGKSFADLVEKSDLFSLVTPRSLALVVFRLTPAVEGEPASLQALNTLNQAFFQRLSARSDIFLTQTTLNGIYCIRLAVGAMKTSEKHIAAAYQLLMEEAQPVVAAWDPHAATV